MKSIITLQKRAREIGRIRIGEKAPSGAPKKLTTFRFTSLHKDAIDAIAALYGGTVHPGSKDLEGQWDVTTLAAEIPVMLPPQEPSQYMEHWSGGGCIRRCDGATELLSGNPCLCELEGSVLCKPTTRLAFILPQVPDLGVWRLETHGWNAAQELMGTYEMLVTLAGRAAGIRCLLACEQRKQVKEGKTKKFVVPVLRMANSLNEVGRKLREGTMLTLDDSEPQTLSAPSAPALTAPSTENAAETNGAPSGSNSRNKVFAILKDFGLAPYADHRQTVLFGVSELLNSEVRSMKGLDLDEMDQLANLMQSVKDGLHEMPEAWKTHFLSVQELPLSEEVQ